MRSEVSLAVRHERPGPKARPTNGGDGCNVITEVLLCEVPCALLSRWSVMPKGKWGGRWVVIEDTVFVVSRVCLSCMA